MNYLIGEVDDARSVKPIWIDQPHKYLYRLANNSGILSCSYSIDGGANYISFPFRGNTRVLPEVAKYTYELFLKMELMNQFREKGEAAISKLNELGSLSGRRY